MIEEVRPLALLLLSTAAAAQYRPPKVIANIDIPHLRESSGLAASRVHRGVFWSHNDSGGGAWLYAFDRSGKSFGRWSVPGARANDWEAISTGPGPRAGTSYLYIGDIGDNESKRTFVTVYRVPEPAALNSDPKRTSGAEPIRLVYPDGPHDAEALMVHPRSGDLYIVTKARGSDADTSVYKAAAPLRAREKTIMKRVAKLELPNTSVFTLLIGRVTGADISPDGKRVAVCDYLKAWEAELPAGARSFDAIWTARWLEIDTGQRAQGEAIAYRHDGKAILTTSEGQPFPLTEAERK
jgi:hypothetical protein